MRRVAVFLLALLLLLPSCHSASAVEIGEIEHALLRVQNALGGKDRFIVADSDFAETNLGNPEYLKEGVICFGDDDETREIGIFRLEDRRKAAEFKQTLRDYLQSEAQALSSLAALYPAEELEARLKLYENASVGSEGMLVWYFVLDDTDKEKALGALTGR